jgi:hypothetical protein
MYAAIRIFILTNRRKSRKLKTSFLVGFLSLCMQSTVFADTIVSTFGPGNSIACCGFGWGNGFQDELAYPFIVPVSSNYVFTTAALALSLQPVSTNTNAVDISLATDASDQPGTILESFHVVNSLGPNSNSNPPVVVNSVLKPLLLAGAQYWLIETPPVSGTLLDWQTAFLGSTQRAFRIDGGSWTVTTIDSSAYPGAFSISGTPSPVPEPSSMMFVVSVILLFAIARLRRPSSR